MNYSRLPASGTIEGCGDAMAIAVPVSRFTVTLHWATANDTPRAPTQNDNSFDDVFSLATRHCMKFIIRKQSDLNADSPITLSIRPRSSHFYPDVTEEDGTSAKRERHSAYIRVEMAAVKLCRPENAGEKIPMI